MGRVLVQIPDPRRHLVRYYGAYSNRARGQRRKAEAPLGAHGSSETSQEPVATPPQRAALRRRWANLIRRVYDGAWECGSGRRRGSRWGELTGPQALPRRDGRIRGAGQAVLYGMDVTDPASPQWVKLFKNKRTVQFSAKAGHRYWVASKAGLFAPRVSKPLRTGLRDSWHQADYVLIAPAAYLEAAQPLLERRGDQGLETKAVSFEEITSQFGYGRPSAEAIRDFLAYAFHNWTEPSLKYVVLLGDASYDPRNFTGLDEGGSASGSLGEDVVSGDVLGSDSGGGERGGRASGSGDWETSGDDGGRGRGAGPEGSGVGGHGSEPGRQGHPGGGQPGHCRLGEAVLAAQAAYAQTGVMPELLAIYHLFGDPGMLIR